jgi:hypothetical protein
VPKGLAAKIDYPPEIATEAEAFIARVAEIQRTRELLGMPRRVGRERIVLTDDEDTSQWPDHVHVHWEAAHLECYYARLLYQTLIAAHPEDFRLRRAFGEVYSRNETAGFPRSIFELALAIPAMLRADPRLDLRTLGPGNEPGRMSDGEYWYEWLRRADYPKLDLPLERETIIAGHILPLGADYRHNYFGGFHEACSIAARDLIDLGDELYATAPIRHVALSYCDEVDPGELADCPHLDRLRSLVFIGGRHGRAHDAWFARFLQSGRLENIRYLHLHESPITALTWQRLGLATREGRLPLLSWVDAVPEPLVDAEARDALERRFGFLPWLHGREFYGEKSPDLERVSEHPLATSPLRGDFEAARRVELAQRQGPVWPDAKPRTVPRRINARRDKLRLGLEDGDPAARWAAELAAGVDVDRGRFRAQMRSFMERAYPPLAAHVTGELEAFERALERGGSFRPRPLPEDVPPPWCRHPLRLVEAGHLADLVFFAGVPVGATVSARTFLHLPETALPPLSHLTLSYAGDPALFDELLASGKLEPLRSLSIPGRLEGIPVNHITAEHVEKLAGAEGLSQLSVLDLHGHTLGFDATEWMAAPEAVARFPRLAVVRGVPFESTDTRMEVTDDDDSLLWESAILERKVPGGIPWMHPTQTLGSANHHPLLVAALTAAGRHLLASRG